MTERKKRQRQPALEWISAATGLVITVGLLGFLSLEVVRRNDGVPPLLKAVPVALTVAGDPNRYFVEVKVTNASHKTGAGVQVEGTLKQGGSEVETSVATLSYVPGDSHRRAGLIFSNDPRNYDFELRVTGYELP